MVEAIFGAVVIVVVLSLGFYLTRGGGGPPGGIDDPAANERAKFDELGDRLPEAGGDP